jgi:hypothetical protein
MANPSGKIHAYFTKMLLAVSNEIEEIGGATPGNRRRLT